MPSRRTSLRSVAASATLPFLPWPRAQAAPRIILNDASRLNPTPVMSHVTITKPTTDDLIARIEGRAEGRHGCKASGRGLGGAAFDGRPESAAQRHRDHARRRRDRARYRGEDLSNRGRQPKVKMAYGRMSVSRRNVLDDALLVTFRPASGQPAPLPVVTTSTKLSGVANTIYRAQTGWEVAKGLRWFMEARLGPAIAEGLYTRNTLMAEPVANLAQKDLRRTDILHEYFVSPTGSAIS